MKNIKRICALLLALVLCAGLLPVQTFAATAWPGLSESRRCEMIAPGQIPVYRNSSLTTRGTCSPARSYNSYLSKNDKIYILEITNSYAKVNFPTSQGRKTGYVKTSTLLGVSAPSQMVKSKAKVTTYRFASRSNTYGYVAVNDSVYKLGTTSSGYVLVMYNVSGGYKAGFVTKSDYEKILGGGQAPTDSSRNMSYALYKSSGGRMTCGFDGYTTTKGRHEGIDFKKGIGKAVYSLTDGVIVGLTEGYRGGKGLSTVAIYSSSTGKTVVYLHMNPLDSLRIGQKISRGQQIGAEDWRGVSKADSAHTHVEVRNGKRSSAAVSVGDYTLDNPNPTAFWNSQGYLVK